VIDKPREVYILKILFKKDFPISKLYSVQVCFHLTRHTVKIRLSEGKQITGILNHFELFKLIDFSGTNQTP